MLICSQRNAKITNYTQLLVICDWLLFTILSFMQCSLQSLRSHTNVITVTKTVIAVTQKCHFTVTTNVVAVTQKCQYCHNTCHDSHIKMSTLSQQILPLLSHKKVITVAKKISFQSHEAHHSHVIVIAVTKTKHILTLQFYFNTRYYKSISTHASIINTKMLQTYLLIRYEILLESGLEPTKQNIYFLNSVIYVTDYVRS